MPSVVRVVGAAQNVDPETHVLPLLAFLLPELLEQSPVIYSEPFDNAQGERNFALLSYYLFTSNQDAKLKTNFYHSILLPMTNRAARQSLDLVFLHKFLSEDDLI